MVVVVGRGVVRRAGRGAGRRAATTRPALARPARRARPVRRTAAAHAARPQTEQARTAPTKQRGVQGAYTGTQEEQRQAFRGARHVNSPPRTPPPVPCNPHGSSLDIFRFS